MSDVPYDHYTHLTSTEDFQKFIRSPDLRVVHFAAKWIDECEQVSDILIELQKLPEIKSSGTKFGKCDAENVDEVAFNYQISSVPTIILFKDGSIVHRIEGVDAPQLTAKIKAHSLGQEPPLEERLKALINQHDVMVFMKGNRENPRCGFSKTLIQILNGIGVQYNTFDILLNEEVRQGLKKFSDWPTYPQLYVKGQLIGGLDIVKELQASGELESTLKG